MFFYTLFGSSIYRFLLSYLLYYTTVFFPSTLLKLDFIKAFNYNQLMFILLPFIVLIIGYGIYLYVFNKKDKILKKIPIWVWVLLLIVFILFGLFRNLDIFPFLRP